MTDEERARARRDSQLIRLASVLLNEFGASEALPGIETAIYMLRALRKRAEQAEAELKAAREELEVWRTPYRPTDNPQPGPRLLLNAYGRRCYDAGREQAEDDLKAAREDNARLTQGIAEVAHDLDQADNPASASDLRDLLAENTDGITVADTWQMAAEDAQAERDMARDALASLGRRAVSDVLRERLRQDAKWGEQNHDPFCYLAVLIEEVGEFAQAALHARFGGEAAEHLRKEAVHAAAVALALVECLDRGSWSWGAHALTGGPR